MDFDGDAMLKYVDPSPRINNNQHSINSNIPLFGLNMQISPEGRSRGVATHIGYKLADDITSRAGP